MLAVPALPVLRVDGAARTTVESWSRRAGRLRLGAGGAEITVRVERCAAGRLKDAYPVGAHDVEVVLETDQGTETASALLRTLVRAVRAADPRCRRVVYAVAEGDRNAADRAASAGFRYVVDVDLADRQLSLLVHEPDWVTDTDADLDHVPGT